MTTHTETGRKMKRKNPFITMDVTSLRDTRLSWKAKGLMTYFLDKPDDWVYILEHLYKQAPEKRAAVASGLKELRTYGYLVNVAYRKGNRVASHGFLVFEVPVKYPSVSPIHVDKLAWEKHLIANDDDIDITIFAKAEKERKEREKANKGKKTPETRATTLESGFLQAENLRAGNQPLLSTYIYNDEPIEENLPGLGELEEFFTPPSEKFNELKQQQANTRTNVQKPVVVEEHDKLIANCKRVTRMLFEHRANVNAIPDSFWEGFVGRAIQASKDPITVIRETDKHFTLTQERINGMQKVLNYGIYPGWQIDVPAEPCPDEEVPFA